MEHRQTNVKCEIHRALLWTLKMSTNNKRTDIQEHSMFTCLLQRHRLFATRGATSSGGGGGADLVGPGAADLVLVLLLASTSSRRALRRAVTALRRLRNRSSTSAHSVVALPTIVES